MDDQIQDKLKADLLDNAPMISLFQDLDHNIQWANRACQMATGLPMTDIIGEKCYSLWGRTAPCAGCPAEVAIQTGEPAMAEFADEGQLSGVEHGRLAKAAPIRDAAGTIRGTVVTVFSLTDYMLQYNRQERAMAALLRLLDFATNHSSKELLQAFLDEAEALTDSQIGFYHFVDDDQLSLSLQTWSSNTLQVCTAPGAGTHYLIQQAGVWVDCVHQGKPVIHNDYASLPHKKGLPDGHVALVRELVVPVVRGGKLVAVLGVGNKGTDYDQYDVKIVGQLAELAWETVVRKRTEEDNRMLLEQFLQSQKMESVGRLAGGVAHDFNNILSVILGFAEMAHDRVAPEDPLSSDLAEILRAGRRASILTRQLLTFARKQAIAPEVLDINLTVEGMFKMLQRLIGEDIELVWLPGDGLWPVEMDPGQVDQVLANLCVNARDAISGVGKIIIETANVTFDERYCADHVGFIPGEYVRLTVSDDGCGIDKEYLDNIFEPFVTSKGLGEGTGLGLSTVYGIIKQNNGFINVYSEPGEGSAFRIYFSRCVGKEEALAPARESLVIAGGAETILLVEDEIPLLTVSKRMVESLGYHVLAASTPREAIKMAAEYAGKIDLLMTDVIMPEMNGRDLSDQLASSYPNLKRLFVSGYTANVISHHGVLDRGINFLQKPFSRHDLSAKIREVLQKE